MLEDCRRRRRRRRQGVHSVLLPRGFFNAFPFIPTRMARQEAYDARVDRLQNQAALDQAAEEEKRLRRASAQWGWVS